MGMQGVVRKRSMMVADEVPYLVSMLKPPQAGMYWLFSIMDLTLLQTSCTDWDRAAGGR